MKRFGHGPRCLYLLTFSWDVNQKGLRDSPDKRLDGGFIGIDLDRGYHGQQNTPRSPQHSLLRTRRLPLRLGRLF